MSENVIGHKVHWLNEVDSTNNYASQLAVNPQSHGEVVAALFQTTGKGQRGNVWESKPSENLLFSIVLKPSFLLVQRQFLISKVAALAICDTLGVYLGNISIKWPNDIYVGNCKIAGILIENSFSSSTLETSVIGIGINVNQVEFPLELPNPTSMRIETSKEYVFADLLTSICIAFEKRYRQLLENETATVNSDYFSCLFRSKGFSLYSSDGEEFNARIVGVRDSGELILETETGERREFAFKEISFLV
jgi:BirA family transcriptional regulator, biotin operon repressor / biotin---[acetyl-CoA-carboxylase] ligase